MENGTYFYLMLFENLGYIRYAFFSLGFILYCAIMLFNVLIMLAIFLERTLHQPMYILISCLSFNSVFGTAGFFPRALTDLLSDTHSISLEACILQSVVIFTYAANEYTILMLMAFDRLTAISKPLRYHNIITPRFLIVSVSINMAFPMILLSICGLLSTKLRMCGNKLFKVYCHNYEVVKLSCESTIITNVFGLLILITTIVIPLSLILYSYVKILIVCQRSSSQFKGKAYQTCIPHIVVLLNFSIAVISEVTLSRVVTLELPIWLSVFLSLGFLIIPPILNPLVYAFNLPDIRKKIICLLNPSR
ncbi:putative gustatory receptor clone PTE03 [Rhinichthys klamathensis goyatoka]|uniref:putative gustatory receptor clone PTE03 n=1 Tax=Rhinichthys klamathensis goyatoka TaxID=3034132 RepID=UPI0024B53364|nr:putative gustatory receptor clone PTE03 [Rhinichthys klamathensis goyatoka]